jgi:hypothetical protein
VMRNLKDLTRHYERKVLYRVTRGGKYAQPLLAMANGQHLV